MLSVHATRQTCSANNGPTMSGKKQHYIPRSLQRGFLFDATSERTYVHLRNGVTRLVSIGDVAARRFFYSRVSGDGTKTLDDKITDYESRLGGLLRQLRAIPIGGVVDARLAAEVIAHLTPRSATLRRMFDRAARRMLMATTNAISDEDTLQQMLGLAEPVPNPVWNRHIADVYEESPQLKAMLNLLQLPSELQDRLIFMAVKEHFAGGYGGYSAMSFGTTKAFASLLEGLDDMLRDAHNKALDKGLVMRSRQKPLEALEWCIRAAPPEGAIMPDCVAIGADEEGATFLPYVMARAATVSAVVMPLTSEKLLVGVRSGHFVPDLANFNHDASACSDEFFIVASNAPVFAKISADLGNRGSVEIDDAIDDALGELLPPKASDKKSGDEKPPLARFSYQLTFAGLRDEEEIARISEQAQRVISIVQPLFNLERLDGVTFAADPQNAIDAMERGLDVGASPEGIPDHIARGASSVLVMRDGAPKLRIVLNASYGLSLVGDDRQDAEVAVHLLVAGLAQADTLNRVEKALPGFLIEPIMTTDHDGLLHCAVRRALRAYRYARDSAGVGADELVEQEFTKYLIHAFDNAQEALSVAKEGHVANPDFPKLFEVAHNVASDMLIAVARLVGHRHGVGKLEFPSAETEVGAAMASRLLTSWTKVFANDLRRFWEKMPWARADFYALNIHVERILWANGLLLWRCPEGEGTMLSVVPQQPPALDGGAPPLA